MLRDKFRPDAGIFGLQVGNADSFITLLAHQAVSMKMGLVSVGHQLNYHSRSTLVVTDLLPQKQTEQKH